ncbi:MAG: DNRLRE domain-containing protein [Candidatus Marinimicrobia bacterium]|nr:DNRLRE domain-containing protein [Candidatus Neomarinimicrobiota bacterium]
MRINPKLQISITGIGFLLLLSASCTEDPYNLNLDDTRLNPSCDSITIKQFTSYQVPPSVGSFSTLFLGNRDGFKVPYTLLRFGDLTSFNDSSYKIDSAYFQITVDSSKSDENASDDQLSLYYMQLDSNYSESSTNYKNDNWVIRDNFLISSTAVQDTIDTLTILQCLRFDIDTTIINSLIDTSSAEYLFILQAEDTSKIHAYYSSESSSYFPLLTVHYTYTDTTQFDTSASFGLRSDVSIIEPPSISYAFDSSYAYLGYGAGLRTLIKSDIDNVEIPKEAVIVEANLIMTVSYEESDLSDSSQFKVLAYSLADSVENWWWGDTLLEDIYYEDIDLYSSSETIQDSILTLNVKNIVQSWTVGASENFGFGLLIVDSHSIFDYAAFYTYSEADTVKWPYLEVLYEAP